MVAGQLIYKGSLLVGGPWPEAVVQMGHSQLNPEAGGQLTQNMKQGD